MMLGRDRFPATRCSGEQILLLQSFSGELNLSTAKRKITCSISSLHEEGVRFHYPLHEAPGSKILLLHHAAGSKFGSRESSQKILEGSLDP
jgi:hypothetical protein